MEKVDYDRRQYLNYQRGRALTPETMAAWMAAFAEQAGDRRPLAVLDLGSGTGRFTPALADTFGGPVYGVEPSVRMRELAERDAAHPGVSYLAGEAGRIPLPDGSCDVVLLFLSFHHVPDRAAAAREIARVLRPGGRVLLRTSFGDRLPAKAWLDYFPRAREVERAVFPTLGDTLEVFGAVGLRQVALVRVRERLASSLAGYVERLSLRASSTFEHLTEAEIEEGFAAMRAAAGAETTPTPVESDSDLLVLGAAG